MNLLEAMRYLAALEQHRHFGRAAQACHITQPALSNAVRALEAEFGVTIVRRGRQYEGLTAEGRQVLATAHRMLHEREMLLQSLRSEREQPRGNLVIGVVPSASPIAARFATALRARHPGLLPVVRSLSSAEIEGGIESLSLDLGFGYGGRLAGPGRGGRPHAIEVVPQYAERYFLLCRRDRMPGPRIGTPIRWAEAASHPLCLLTPEMHNRAIVDDAFQQAGTPVKPVIETNSVLIPLVAALSGEVRSVMPGALVALAVEFPQLVALPLIEPLVVTPIDLLVPSGSPLSIAQQAALAWARSDDWLRTAAAHSGQLS